MSHAIDSMKTFLRAPMLSPLGLLLWAVRLTGVVLVLHLFGARACTAVLSGTLREPLPMFLGVSYTFTYFVAAAFAPPLLAAAVLLSAILRGRAALARSFEARRTVHLC